MRMLARWMVRALIADSGKVNDPAVRAHYGALEAWTALGVNIVLCLTKLVMGVILHSVALVGDGVNQLGDAVISVIMLVGFRLSGKPGDAEHPFGHGRMEPIVTLVVGVLMAVAGVELFKSSVAEALHPHIRIEQAAWWVWVVLAATIVLKELLARFADEMGRLIDSDTLRADAWNHRFDVLATLVVVVSLLGARYNHRWVDGIGGIVVSGIIILTAAKIVRTALNPLLGEPPSPETLKRIETLARSVTGVEGVHDIIVHRYGRMWIISLHIEVRDDAPVVELHDLSEQVEEAVEREFYGDTVVHLDPINKAHPRYEEVTRAVTEVISADERINSYHDLRLIGHDAQLKAVFDIVPQRKLSPAEEQQLKRDVRQQLRQRLEQVRFSMTVEPIYKKTAEGKRDVR